MAEADMWKCMLVLLCLVPIYGHLTPGICAKLLTVLVELEAVTCTYISQ